LRHPLPAARVRDLRVVLDIEETASRRGSVRPGLDPSWRPRNAARSMSCWCSASIAGAIDAGPLTNIRRLRAAGVAFVAIAQGLEVQPERDDGVSELTLNILAAAAEFERAVIVERTLDGLAAARRAGIRVG
jgi:resolvase-like protein